MIACGFRKDFRLWSSPDGHPHAKLFPLIGRKVRTPRGLGIQVFAERVTVLLDSERAFRPTELEPVSWEA